MCEMTEVLDHPERWEYLTGGHEWDRAPKPEAASGPRILKDAHGNVLADRDGVILIKDLKRDGSQMLKSGTKSKPIRLVDGDREIDCKVGGIALGLKACFAKKA